MAKNIRKTIQFPEINKELIKTIECNQSDIIHKSITVQLVIKEDITCRMTRDQVKEGIIVKHILSGNYYMVVKDEIFDSKHEYNKNKIRLGWIKTFFEEYIFIN